MTGAEMLAEARAALNQVDLLRDDAVPPGPDDCDVAVIGAGQSGIAIAFALRRAGIRKVAVFDRAAEGAEGIWTNIARMTQLRSEKIAPGHELGLQQLTFRHWYTGRYGAAAFAAMDRTPPPVWQDYLTWYRQVSGITPHWQHALTRIEPGEPGQGLALDFATPRGPLRISARKLVLATGMDGTGYNHIPDEVTTRLPADRYSHSQEEIDFDRLRGKRVAVVGAAASAFDAASTALETGATRVCQFVRGAQLAKLPAGGWDTTGIAQRQFFYDMPDSLRWQISAITRRRGAAPPWSVERATQHAAHSLHFSTSLASLRMEDDIVLTHDGQKHGFDHLILGTGYRQDLTRRPELAALAPLVQLWRHRDVPITPEDRHWGEHPYVGPGFELLERVSGTAPWLNDIHVYTFASIVSHGMHIGDIASASTAIPRLVTHLRRGLFEAHSAAYRSRIEDQLHHFIAYTREHGDDPVFAPSEE